MHAIFLEKKKDLFESQNCRVPGAWLWLDLAMDVVANLRIRTKDERALLFSQSLSLSLYVSLSFCFLHCFPFEIIKSLNKLNKQTRISKHILISFMENGIKF